MSNVFGKVEIAAGRPQILEIGGSGLSGVLIANESGLTCTVEMQGANVKRSLYAGTVDFFAVPKGVNWTGNLIISPSADLNNISFWPSTFVQIDTFGSNEAPMGTYPMNLNRTGNIGNQVSTVSGSSTSVQNDNNVAGTEFIEATVLGSPSSNEAHFVDGSGWLGRWNNPTFTKVLQWFSSGTTALQLGAVAYLTQVLGNLQVDGTASFNSAGATIDNTSAFNGSAVNVTTAGIGTANVGTINVTTVNDTTINTQTLNATSNITESNNQSLRWKDTGGTPRNVLNVDGSNNVNLSGITGKDAIQFLTAAGAANLNMDLTNGILGCGVSQSVNGDTSGTMTVNEFITGTVKIVMVSQSNYRQAGGTGNSIALKNGFIRNASIMNMGCGGINLRSGVTAQTLNIVTALALAGGSFSTSTQIQQFSIGGCNTAFDHVSDNGSYSSAHDGVTFIIGR